VKGSGQRGNVMGLRYNRGSRSLVRMRPPRAYAAVSVHRIPKGGTMPELSALPLVNLHLVTVPDAAPPYDGQIHGARCPPCVAGRTDAVDWPAAERSAALAQPPAGAGAAGADMAGADMADADPAGAGMAGADPAGADMAGAGMAGAGLRRLAVVIVEVLAGVRPDRQLVPLANDRVRARIRGLVPLLASDRRPRIARIVTSRPAARVVEMTVVVHFGVRSRALAMRFEHVAARPASPGWAARPARWLCTAIEAG
jgi:hypothetical protein